MGFQPPVSVKVAIDNIERKYYLLPAIQRDYVWKPGQVIWLFDSLMRKYPISSFLFGEVRGQNTLGYKFYNFVRKYRETFCTSGEEQPVSSNSRFLAVLDGQQRLTSLYILV